MVQFSYKAPLHDAVFIKGLHYMVQFFFIKELHYMMQFSCAKNLGGRHMRWYVCWNWPCFGKIKIQWCWTALVGEEEQAYGDQ